MSASTFAVLFKGDGSEKQLDPYVQELQKIGMNSYVIPVLWFEFINSKKLLEELQHPDEYSGIIFTSVRAVEAVQKSLELTGDHVVRLLEHWNSKQNFSVGAATSAALKSVLKLNSKGEVAGNSQSLCEIVVKLSPVSCKPFLYPCSSIRKDTIPNVLNAEGIKVTEVISYETTCHPLLKESWESLIKSKGNPEYLIFFSPSGVQFVLPVLLSTFSNPSLFKFVAIGPSTEQALQACGQQPWKVAENPNPKSLCEALH